MFILTTTKLHKIPTTILSHVQHFQFKLDNHKQIKQKLKHILNTENYTIEPIITKILFNLTKNNYKNTKNLLSKLIDNLTKNITNITKQDTYTTLNLPTKKQINTLINHLLNSKIKHTITLIKKLKHNNMN